MSEKHTCKYLQFGKVYNSAILVKVTNVEHHLKCSNISFLILQLDLLSFFKIVSIVHKQWFKIHLLLLKVWFHKFCYLCKRNILMAMSYVDCVLVLLNVIAFHTCPSVYVCLHMCIYFYFSRNLIKQNCRNTRIHITDSPPNFLSSWVLLKP